MQRRSNVGRLWKSNGDCPHCDRIFTLTEFKNDMKKEPQMKKLEDELAKV